MDFESVGHSLLTDWTRKRVEEDRHQIPSILWHYTAARGLKGILESQRLWATDTRFLNDATELLYGIEVFVSTLRDHDLTGCKPLTQRFVRDMIRDGGEAVKRTLFNSMTLSVFVACFCTDGDLLSQWRAYTGLGEQVGSYALGFQSKQPQSWVQVAGHGFTLRRVRYEPDEQQAICSELVSDLISLLDNDPTGIEAQKSFGRNLIDGLIEFASFCKHPSFHEELEWRIVYVRSTDEVPLELSFCDSRSILVPHVELALPEPTGARAGVLPIRYVRHGPSVDPTTVQLGLRTYLQCTRDFKDVKIDGSLTPLRL